MLTKRVAIVAVLAFAAGKLARTPEAGAVSLCLGDFDDNGKVTVDELVAAVDNAVTGCPRQVPASCEGDFNGDGAVTVDELVRAVHFALTGCGPSCGDEVLDEEVGEECDDGNNLGGDGCAANCTVESLRQAAIDPDRSVGVVQQNVVPVSLRLSGTQTLRTGSPRDVVVRDPRGNVITRAGEIPVVIKAAEVLFEPIRLPGLLCLCIRGVEAPQHGEGNSGSGIIGCGPAGLTDIDYKIAQDHNTTPGDPGNGHGSCQLPDDPECDDSFTLPGCGISTARRDAEGHCNSPRVAHFFGGRQPPGSALIHSSIAIGLLRDGGMCLKGAAARNADDSCMFPDYGDDCAPCTEDDADPGQPECFPSTTGSAAAALFDAGGRDVTIDDGSCGFRYHADDCAPCTEDDADPGQPECFPSTTGSAAAALFDAGGPDVPIDADCVPGVIIFTRGSGRLCTSSSQCSPGESCGQTCDTSGKGCENDGDCPPGDSCGPRRCQVLCGGGSRCFTTARGARFDCDALAANPTGGVSGAVLARAFPSFGASIGFNVTTFVLAFGSGSATVHAAPAPSRRVDGDRR